MDTRGAWALGQIGASITWGHGVVGDAGGPNITENDLGPDDIVKGRELYLMLGREFIDGERMQCCDHCDENFQATARSKHPGGVQVLMLDGAVRFVSNEVDAGLWHVMHSRETPSETFKETFGAELNGPHWTEAPKPEDSGAPHVTPHSAPSGGEPTKDVVNSLGMKFVRIPAGEFMMGLPDEDQHLPFPPDAVPHRVRITHDYYLGQFEATQKQYERVMGENPSWHVPTGGGKTLIKLSNTAQCPVENVSWYDAIDFCRRLGELPDEISAGRRYRLPTEAEWERACRAGLSGPISFNRVWDSTDKTGEIAGREKPPKDLVTVPVGSYEPNAFGLFDMCGNVYEWVSDFRATGYYARSRVDDPQGPSSGYMHVIRGWHWAATGPKCKVYVASDPWTGSRFIGFRVVCTPGSD